MTQTAKYQSIRLKFVLLSSRILLTSFIAIFFMSIVILIYRSLKESYDIEKKTMADLTNRGTLLVSNNCIALRELVNENAFSLIREIVSTTVKGSNGQIVSGIFMDNRRIPWAIYGSDTKKHSENYSEALNDSMSLWADTLSAVSSKHTYYNGSKVIEFAAPIFSSGVCLGTIRYSFPLSFMQAEIDAAKRRIFMEGVVFVLGIFLIIGVLFFILRGAAYKQADSMTLPLTELTEAVIRISKGEEDAPLKTHTDDEIGFLAQEFGKMRHIIKQHTLHLEELVMTRTSQLNSVQNEKMMEENKLATLGTLLASAAHEINNPNNAIILSSEILRDVWNDLSVIFDNYVRSFGDFSIKGFTSAELSLEIPDSLDRVIKNAHRIRSFVEELKQFARKDTSASMELFDLNAVVSASISIINDLIRKSTDSFTVSYGNNLPKIKGVPRHFEQVIINLLQNACHALKSNKSGIAVATSYDEKEQKITVTIADQGIGMTPEIRKKILEPFFTTKGDKGGTGLGLTVTTQIINNYNCLLEFDSESGIGTTARVVIPVTEKVDCT